MWRNYLTVSLRSLAKNKTYSFINIFGLALGSAACLLILTFIGDQLSYDRFLPDADRIYQLQAVNTDLETGTVQQTQMSPLAAGRALAKDFPEVEIASYLTNSQPVILIKGEPVQRTITLADAGFFRIYDIPFLHGSGAAALAQPGTIAVSARSAKAMFGTANAVGRVVTVLGEGERTDYKVSGVFADLPDNSHQAFGMIRRFTPEDVQEGQEQQWGWFSGYNYFKLRQGADVAAINARLDAWAKRVAPSDVVDGQAVSQTAENRFRLVPVPDVHLSGAGAGPAGGEGDWGTIVTLAIVGGLVLAMAIVNFVNLATARASVRAREVSLRKVLGASRRQLIVQFLLESIAVAGMAMLLALAVTELALPWLRTLLDLELRFSYFGAGGLLLPVLALILLVGLAGGLYPALYLTRFNPAQVLRANKSAAEPAGSGRMRNILVVGQFAISIALIICTAVIYAQTVYARTVDPGFKRTGLLQIEGLDRPQVRARIDGLEREIGHVPGVERMARTRIGIETNSRIGNNVTVPGRPRPLELGTYQVGFGFLETMGIEPLSGRTLSSTYALDDATLPEERDDAAEQALIRRGINVVVNESAARQIGFLSPAKAIGKSIGVSLADPENGVVPARIVGVVPDTRYRSIREPVEDIIYYHDANSLDYLLVRFRAADPRALRERVGAAWKKVVPDVPFSADLADERVADLYRTEDARAAIFAAFAFLAVLIACLGLFGLAAFTAERRTKEIGIRKVFGARVRDIVRLLAWQFSKPVIVANLIAWPVAWWVMRDWLNGFDARIALTPGPFLLAGFMALVIAIGTIASHAVKVARTNPIHALRYE
jgi:putative ABC transport system permease protein